MGHNALGGLGLGILALQPKFGRKDRGHLACLPIGPKQALSLVVVSPLDGTIYFIPEYDKNLKVQTYLQNANLVLKFF